MMPRSQTSMRLKTDTLEKLKLLKKQKKLLRAMSERFLHAGFCLNYLTTNDKKWAKKYEKEYQSVKPILDDCIDKLLGETK